MKQRELLPLFDPCQVQQKLTEDVGCETYGAMRAGSIWSYVARHLPGRHEWKGEDARNRTYRQCD